MVKGILCAMAPWIIPVVAWVHAAGADQGQGNGYAYGHEKRGEAHVVTAPEIDPGAATGALFLLVAGTLILVDRSRHVRRSLRD
jgi:hypothetical protein